MIDKYARLRRGQVLAVFLIFVLVFASAAINVKWMDSYRYGGVLDIDEAGYLGYSMLYAKSLAGGGVGSWLSAINAPGAHAPLLPAISSILLAGTGFSINAALLTNTAIFCGLIFLTCCITFKISGSQSASLFAAFAISSMPAIVDYSRNFHFALLATLCYAGATFAILKSNGYRSLSWSMVTGVLLGMMVLSRTMTVAFLPAFAIASALYIASGDGVKERLVWRNVLAAVIFFFLTALTWYAGHFKEVFGYLFSFGYGAHAVEYGKGYSGLGVGYVFDRVAVLFELTMRPIHFMVLVPVSIIAVMWACGSMFRGGLHPFKRYIIFCGALVLVSFGILSSSQNRGSGFDVPMLPIVVAISASFLAQMVNVRRYRCWMFAVLGSFFAPLIYGHMAMENCKSLSMLDRFNIIGGARLFECRGTIHQYVSGSGEAIYASNEAYANPLGNAENAEWRVLSKDVANYIALHVPVDSVVMYATRNYLFNVNTVGLETINLNGRAWPARQIDPTILGDSQGAYISWIQGGLDQSACLVIQSDGVLGEFKPAPSLEFLRSAIENAGLRPVKSFPTPSGQSIIIWMNPRPHCMPPL